MGNIIKRKVVVRILYENDSGPEFLFSSFDDSMLRFIQLCVENGFDVDVYKEEE